METNTTTKTVSQAANNTLHITGAEAVIRCLLAEGVDLVYGYPGGAIMPIYDELYKFQHELHHVLTRHEQGAAHAAQGYARVSGKVGGCYGNFWARSYKLSHWNCGCPNRFNSNGFVSLGRWPSIY